MSDQNQPETAAAVAAQESIPEQEVVIVSDSSFDDHYLRLRTTIADVFTAAISEGRTLYRGNAVNPMSFGTFMACVPEDLKSHFNCNCCRGFLNRFSGLLLQNPADGTYHSPVAKIFEEDEFFGPKLKELGINLNMKAAARSAVPVGFLNSSFSRATTLTKSGEGMWSHFHGSSIDQTLEYNKKHNDGNNTINRGVAIWEKIRALGVNNGPLLLQLHGTISARLTRPESVGLIKPYAELMNKLAGFSNGGQVAYISGLLMQTDYKWLDSIYSSSADQVLKAAMSIIADASTTTQVVNSTVNLINEFTRAEVYKNRMADASNGLVEGTVATLKEDGLETALERIPVVFDDLDYIWRFDDVKAEADQQQTEGEKEDFEKKVVSALDAAANSLKSKDGANAEAAAAAAISAFENINVISKDISIAGFVQMLREGGIETIELAMRHVQQLPVCWTKPVDGKLYPELLKYVSNYSEKGFLGIGLTTPVDSITGMYFTIPPGETRDSFDYAPLRGVIETRDGSGTLRSLVAIADHIGFKMFTGQPAAGTFIFGPHIQNKYSGYSRALTQLAARIPMEIPKDAAGGFQLGVGHTVKVKHTGGLTSTYTLRSIE